VLETEERAVGEEPSAPVKASMRAEELDANTQKSLQRAPRSVRPNFRLPTEGSATDCLGLEVSSVSVTLAIRSGSAARAHDVMMCECYRTSNIHVHKFTAKEVSATLVSDHQSTYQVSNMCQYVPKTGCFYYCRCPSARLSRTVSASIAYRLTLR